MTHSHLYSLLVAKRAIYSKNFHLQGVVLDAIVVTIVFVKTKVGVACI